MYLFFTLIFFIYYFQSLSSSFKVKIYFTFLFVVITFIFQLFHSRGFTPDYYTYLDNFSNYKKPIFNINFFISEPYYYAISNYLLKYFNKISILEIFYWSCYLLTTVFFCWLSYTRDIEVWKKALFFNIFYILFSLVLIRNTIAYLGAGLLFYHLSHEKLKKIYLLSFVAHLSAFPVVFTSLLKNRKSNYAIFLFAAIVVLSFYITINYLTLPFSTKIKDYLSSSTLYWTPFHIIYFFFILFISISFIYFYKHIFSNFTFILLIAFYLSFQYLNPIMGFRFSFYLIIYILLNSKFSFPSTLTKQLNLLSLISFPIGLFTTYLFYIKH